MAHPLLPTLAALSLICIASAQQPVGTPSDSPTFGTTVVLPGGLRGTVYSIPKGTMVLPDLQRDGNTRLGELWTDSLNIPPRHWRAGFPGLTQRFEWFAIDYNGRFWIDKPGRYTFALLSDDGSRLFVDDTPVIDNDCQHPPDLRLAAVQLTAGAHRLRVAYFQGPRDCLALILAITGPGQPWTVFSTKDFSPPPHPEHWTYPADNAVTLVATTPSEASLTVDALLHRLAMSKDRSCMAQPVRTCGP